MIKLIERSLQLLTKEVMQEIIKCLSLFFHNNLGIYKFQNYMKAMIHLVQSSLLKIKIKKILFYKENKNKFLKSDGLIKAYKQKKFYKFVLFKQKYLQIS